MISFIKLRYKMPFFFNPKVSTISHWTYNTTNTTNNLNDKNDSDKNYRPIIIFENSSTSLQ